MPFMQLFIFSVQSAYHILTKFPSNMYFGYIARDMILKNLEINPYFVKNKNQLKYFTNKLIQHFLQ